MRKEKRSRKKEEDEIYKYSLKRIVKMIGSNDTTYSDQLHKVAKKLLGKEFSGVYAVDKLRFPKGTRYAIINLDFSDQPGSHWIGVVKEGKRLLIYDSFGRPGIEIVPHLKKHKGLGLASPGKGRVLMNTELDAEQKIKENNCGQRSLTSLFIHRFFGRDIFMKL